MENNNVEQGELFKFFKEKSGGIGFTFDQLYEKCTSYVDHFEFSRELNRLVKLKLIQKREKFYFYVDPTAEIKRLLEERPELKAEMGVQETPPEPKPEPRVHLVERKKPEPEPVIGSLRRTLRLFCTWVTPAMSSISRSAARR